MPWICSIYEERPDQCRNYPVATSFIPESCGFVFLGDGKRRGRCEPECGATCCQLPRMNGDPEGAALPKAAGGEPCRYLVWTDDDVPFEGESVKKDEKPPAPQADTAESEA